MRRIGVVLGAGVGARLGLATPKQMVKVAGKSILEHTVATMAVSADLDEVIVMITPGWKEQAERILGDKYPKVSRIIEGGATRNETTSLVLEALGAEDCKVVLHDAVRPLVDERIIHDCVAALNDYGAVDVVIPSADTIVQVDGDEVISDIPDRATLRRGQTPQAFRLSVLKEAYARAAKDPGFRATDDCGVVLKYMPEVPIKTVPGTEHNLKITHPIDLFIADKLFQLASNSAPERVAAGARMDGKVIVILGGTYGIGAEIGKECEALGATVVSHGRSNTGLHVEDPAQVQEALDETARQHGRIDAVVLTAGMLQIGRLAETAAADLRKTVGVNLMAPIYVAQSAFKYLKETHGHLLFFTSSSYTRGREDYAVYSATKAAVVNLTQALSEEWSDDQIKVNVINPERTATPMRTAAFGQEDPNTLLTVDQVGAASLAVLLSDVTGQVVDVRRAPAGKARSQSDLIESALAQSQAEAESAAR